MMVPGTTQTPSKYFLVNQWKGKQTTLGMGRLWGKGRGPSEWKAQHKGMEAPMSRAKAGPHGMISAGVTWQTGRGFDPASRSSGCP